MSVVRRLAVAAATIGVLVATAAGSSGPPRDRAWADNVERWVDSWQAAAAEGIPNLGAFLTADVAVDHRGAGEGDARGRDDALAFYRSLHDIHASTVLRGPAYASTTGMVLLSRWTLNVPHGTVRTDGRQDAAVTMTFTSSGLNREDTALSVLSARWRNDFYRVDSPPPTDWEQLATLATRYLQVWSHGDASAAAALYDDTVEVRDNLLGVRLDGLTAVRHAVVRQPGLHVSLLPDLGGPAVFGDSTNPAGPFTRAVLLLEPDDQAACPGRTAIVLSLTATGTVTTEERYHRLDDLRHCLPSSERPSGWWDTLSVPDPVQLQRTGTLDADGKRVEIWNATPQLEQLLRWAFNRYKAAGLPAPAPRSVTFYPAAPDRCGFNLGVAGGVRLTELTLCFGTQEACPDPACPPWSPHARRVVLHELAHTWMAQHLNDAVRQQYLDQVHLRWNDPNDPWNRRGIERAADTVAWGLIDQALPLPQSGNPPEEQLTAEFLLLTGTRPLQHPAGN